MVGMKVPRSAAKVRGSVDRDHPPEAPIPNPRGLPMAKPNYNFEKRQRELAKKKKKEEKRLKNPEAKKLQLARE